MDRPAKKRRRRRALGVLAGLTLTLGFAGALAVLLVRSDPRGELDNAGQRLGLRLYDDSAWRRLTPGETPAAPVVILIHGLDEPGDVWDDLTPTLADAGLTPIRFDYPNDQAIAPSADFLATSLRGLRTRGVDRCSVVAHSMGGLVTLDTLTRPDADDGMPTIQHVITIGTPFSGSPWAGARWAAELREQAQRLATEGISDLSDLWRFLGDGEGEAATDLTPGSAFLTDLRARPLPPGVAFTCLVGRIVPDDPSAPAGIGEISAKLGDGVVPIASASLGGVTDVVELPADHRSMVRRVPIANGITAHRGDARPDAPPPAIEVILDRLTARPASPEADPDRP